MISSQNAARLLLLLRFFQETDCLYIVKNKNGRKPTANTIYPSVSNTEEQGQCRNLITPPNPNNSATTAPEIIFNRSDIVLVIATLYLSKANSGTKTSNSDDAKTRNSFAAG